MMSKGKGNYKMLMVTEEVVQIFLNMASSGL